MKKILLFLFLLPLFAIGKHPETSINISIDTLPNRFPSIDSAKNYSLRYVKNSAVESFTNLRMQNVVYGTLQLLDSLCGAGVIDTIWKSGDTLKYRIGTQTVIVGVFGGSGSTPTLQQVTNQGNSTTDSINIIDGGGNRVAILTKLTTGSSSGQLMLRNSANTSILSLLSTTSILFNKDGLRTVLSYGSITKNNDINLPDSSGTLPLRIKLNNTTYAPASNGTVDLGTISSDTATVVKAYVTNAESVTITKGQVVYIFGASGDRASVKLARNTSDTFSSKTLGIVRENIAAGQTGWITTQGQVSGINLGAYTPGDILWLDSIAGSFTSTKPQAPYHAVFIGVVERANVGNGLIYVKPQNGVELSEIHDIRITSLANNDVIRYNSSLGYWENKSIETTSGVQWTGVDSTFAYQQAKNGFHELIDFNGQFGSLANSIIPATTYGANAMTVNGITDANAFGIAEIKPSGASTYGYMYHGSGTSARTWIVLDANPIWLYYRIRIPNLADGSNDFSLIFGLQANLGTTALSNSVCLAYMPTGAFSGSASSGNWQIMTASASNRTWTTTSTAVPSNTWTTIAVRATSTRIDYFVDGVNVGSITNNIPTVALYNHIQVQKVNGASARGVDIDFLTIDKVFSR
jgi:hypothetical protein